MLGLIGSGGQPTVEEILACKQLFMDEPYHLLYLSRNHIVSIKSNFQCLLYKVNF